jgi:hypothetical protein
MQTELLSLSKIFTERLFRIPDYQRGYSWSDRQLKDFWSDIVLLDDGRDHYTGVLTLEQVSPAGYAGWTDDAWIINSKRYAPFYVVDGQQRLTTALILLQAILEKSGIAELNYTTTDEIRKKFIFETRDKGVSRSYIFGYEKDNPSYEFLKTRIFDERSDDHNIGEETIYTHNLTRAKSFFLTQIATLAPDDIAKIYTKLTQHFLFNIYTISADIDVFVAFETMNNRGKPLSNLELLKNRLIFLSTRLGVDATERQKVRSTVNESWKTAYHYLGRNQLEPIRDDLFLMIQCAHYYCSSLFSGGLMDSAGYRHTLRMMQNDEEYFKQYLLETVFTSRNIGRGSDGKVSSSSIYEYAHDLKKSVHVLYEILNPHDSKFTDEQKVLLAKLNRLASHEVAYLTLVFAAVIRSRKEDLTRFLREFERLLFFFSFGAFRGDGTRAVFEPVKLVVSMRKDGASLDDACAQIADYADFCAKELATSVLISERSARGSLRPLRPDHLRDLVELVALGLHLHHEAGALDRLVGPAGPNAVPAVREQGRAGQEAAEHPQAQALALQAGDGDQFLVGGEAGHGSRRAGWYQDRQGRERAPIILV